VFKHRIINSVHTSNDSLQRRGVTLSLENRIGDKEDAERSAKKLTTMTLGRSPTDTRSNSRGLALSIKRMHNAPPRS
jgi:hypothetical protein